MKRLEINIKKELIEDIELGKSLNYLSKKFGKGKTTIYYYIRKIKGKKHQPIKLNLKDLDTIGEIIGVFAGDGYYAHDEKRADYRIKICFNATETNVIEHYKLSFNKLTGKFPGIIHSGSVKIMQICSKDFCNFILSYLSFGRKKVSTIHLRDKSYYLNKKFMKGFIRGLIDSDGYVRKGSKEIYFGSISHALFKDFLEGLDLFKFNYKTYVQKGKYKDFYKVRLSGQEVDKFIHLIKPAKAIQ